MVSITALEFSYTQAPRKMKSLIMGVYLLSVTFGNLITAQVNGFIDDRREAGKKLLEGADYFWFFTIVMAVAAILYVIWSQFYRGQTYIQGEAEPLSV
jgi:proton-dependent oligopeptide transporter, POT family